MIEPRHHHHRPPAARLRTSAGALILNGRRKVLLVQPTYKPYWDLPGGCGEPFESPRDTVTREVKEELGIPLPIGRLLVVDYIPATKLADASLAFVFYAPAPPNGVEVLEMVSPQTTGGELYVCGWCDDFAISDRVAANAPMLARRIRAAQRAYEGNTTLYLESGWEVLP